MVAAAAGKLDAVDMLLGVGAAVDATRGDGTTAACWAARGGHGDVLRLLLDNGANVNHVDVLDGSSLLHFAAQASTAEAVEIALEAGANAFARTHIMVRRVNFKIAFLSTYNDSRPSGRIL
jgi:ankyrin repeat protein